MQRTAITNIDIVTEEGIIPSGTVIIQDQKIDEVTQGYKNNADSVIDGIGKELTLVPGFIDVHIHGANGYDVMDGTAEALHGIASQLPKEGTTSFLATTMTQSNEAITHAVRNAGRYIELKKHDGEAEILGIHLEGPFINRKKAGAQPSEHIIPPSLGQFYEWQHESQGQIKLITLAPEIEGALNFINEVGKTGVICSLGHSEATYEEAQQAVFHGASHVTHLFNQMSGFHHRDPGLAGAALMNQELMVELIADHIHVHPSAVQLAYQMIGSSRTILITDAMRAKCLPEGTYDLGGQDVEVKNGEARLLDGTLAGSILTLEEAVQKMTKYAGLEIKDLVKMTSSNAAKHLGIYERKGSITSEKDADLVLLNKQNEVVMTMCKGKVSFDREGMV